MRLVLLTDGLHETHGVIRLQNHGPHGLDALCTPLLDEKGKLNGRLIVLRDITERLHMEQELRRSEEHYRSFLAMVSHELRTPLTGILGMAEAMQANVYGPLNERQVRSLNVIEQSGRHLAAVINDMLDLSRIQAGTLELHLGGVQRGRAWRCQHCSHTRRGAAQAARGRLCDRRAGSPGERGRAPF